MDCRWYTSRTLGVLRTFGALHLKPVIFSRRRFPTSHWRRPMTFSRKLKAPAAASLIMVQLLASILASTFIVRWKKLLASRQNTNNATDTAEGAVRCWLKGCAPRNGRTLVFRPRRSPIFPIRAISTFSRCRYRDRLRRIGLQVRQRCLSALATGHPAQVLVHAPDRSADATNEWTC